MAPIGIAATLVALASVCIAASNPISVASVVVLGNQTSGNDPGAYRDAGYEGQIGNTYFQVYADTQHCDPNNAAANCNVGTFRGNTVALSTSNPQVVTDFVTPYPAELCASPASGYRLHITNIISLSSTTGVAWYGNISSDTSTDIDGAIVGSGVAMISYSGSGSPTCKVLPQFWGDTEPIWGDHGVIGHNLDGYIYLLGVLGSHTPGYNYSDVFAARVASGSTGTLSAYRYWNGTAYGSKRLTYPDYNGYAPAAVIQGTPQGSIVYNSYYNLYIYLSPGPALSGQILAATSQNPSGPWSNTIVIYQGDKIYYAPVAQGHFDTSGKTLIFDMSIFSPIYLQTVKVTFK